MAVIFWDASGLIKRYFSEAGSATVNALFGDPPKHDNATTPSGYTETYAALLRKRNGGVLNQSEFAIAAAALQAEVIHSPDFGLFSITDQTILASIEVIHRHNLNSTDAAILRMLLEYTQTPGASPIFLIAADQRLLRAAAAEGLATLNPELVSPADVPALLAAL